MDQITGLDPSVPRHRKFVLQGNHLSRRILRTDFAKSTKYQPWTELRALTHLFLAIENSASKVHALTIDSYYE
jgi:hypothetical protein